MMKRNNVVLVTGGAGYIGSHTCKALSKAGCLPVTYDNLIYGHENAVKWGPLEVGDITDAQRIDQVVKQYEPSAIMHFAAYAYVGESVENPAKYYRNNVLGSLILIEAMLSHHISRMIFSSSCAVYGMPSQTPIPENHPINPMNPYGNTKAMVEQVLRDVDAAYGLKSICLRYFNAAGADAEGDIGETHEPETHLIPLALEVAMGNKPYITINGDDYDTPDGTCIRDFIHVTDLAQAHVLALKRLEETDQSAVYNLGNGEGFSVKKVIDTSRLITGKEIPFKIGDRRPGDPPKLVGDSVKAKKELGWRPDYVSLNDIIGTAWSWTLKT